MTNRKLYPMTSAKAYYRPGELVIVAVCPYPFLFQHVGIARTLLTVEPPAFELFSERVAVWGGAGVQSLTVPPDWPGFPGKWPPIPKFPIPHPPPKLPGIELTITVTEVFKMERRPDVIKLYHADGVAEIKVEDIAEAPAASGGGGGAGAVKFVDDAKGVGDKAEGAGDRAKRASGASVDATGYSDVSLEDAFHDAAARAFEDLPASHVMDGMTRVEIRSSGAIYGGIQGRVGRYYVEVRATRQ